MADAFVRFENFLEKVVAPWLENFLKVESNALIAALAPIMEKEVADGLPLLAAATSPTQVASALASILGSALTSAEQKGIQVTAVTALQTLGGAVANLQASQTPAP